MDMRLWVVVPAYNEAVGIEAAPGLLFLDGRALEHPRQGGSVVVSVVSGLEKHQVLSRMRTGGGLARSLGGVASERSLADLLTTLDETNIARVVRAIAITCQGQNAAAGGDCESGQGVLW